MSFDGLTPIMKQHHAMRPSLPADVLLFFVFAVAVLFVDRVVADFAVRQIEIAPRARESRGDHAGGTYLFRAMGAQMVAPKPAALTLTWLMPMLTDCGIYPPRPLDMPL